MSKAVRTFRNYCLNCGVLLDTARAVGHDNLPVPGDVDICFRCNHVMMFDGALKLRNPTAEERAWLEMHPVVIAAKGRIKTANDDK